MSVACYEIAWTAPIAWPLAPCDLFEFYLLPALVDQFVAVAIVLFITAACEARARRQDHTDPEDS
jgi:hypothetical protein